MNHNKGITLIALVVTIIVLLILSGVSITLLIGQDSIMEKATQATKEQEIATIKELVNLELIDSYYEEEKRYFNTDEVNEIAKDNIGRYRDKIGVYREQIMYLGKEDTEEASFMESKGIEVINMTPDEFKYYIEMGILEDKVKANKGIGRELQTNNFTGTINIGSNTYGIGWYLIGNYTEEEKINNTYQKDYEDLGLEDITHAPYLVNYETGIVLSIDGMVMYESQILVHSFNDDFDKNLANVITYVNSFTYKTGEAYGNLISTSKYTGKVDTNGGIKIYQDNEGLLEYDEEGALILDSDNAIPVLEIDNKYKIEDNYSINLTIEGNYMQKPEVGGWNRYPSTILALSESNTRYLSWIGVYNGYLQVYAFYAGNALENIEEEVIRKGFASIDISKYQGQKLNIQVTATRGANTDVYINGEKVVTFESGTSKMNFKYTTLGDLRVGRNLKFAGKIYEFGIYGIAIDEESIQSNWKRAQRYF